MVSAFVSEVAVQLKPKIFNSYLALLPESEQFKIRRFVNWRDAHLSLFGKLLLIRGLMQRGYRQDKIMHLAQGRYRRPFLKGGPEFNISHAGRFVVCILADEKVGVDVEQIRPIKLEDFRSQWTEKEWEDILGSQDFIEKFYRYWTKKEAVIKADGRGMYLPLHTLDVSTSPVVIGNNAWFLSEVDLDKSYCCSVATRTVKVQIDKQFHDFYENTTARSFAAP
jgi:4'-phosphopantetheinyl transferase